MAFENLSATGLNPLVFHRQDDLEGVIDTNPIANWAVEWLYRGYFGPQSKHLQSRLQCLKSCIVYIHQTSSGMQIQMLACTCECALLYVQTKRGSSRIKIVLLEMKTP